MAKVVAICLNEERGCSKKSVSQGILKEDYGLIGDGHAGSDRQVSLLAIETINKLLAALESINTKKASEYCRIALLFMFWCPTG